MNAPNRKLKLVPRSPGIQPEAFSYIRFSSPEQSKGDSLRRQLEASRAYAEARGLKLNESLRDEGLSGYKGLHRIKGALGSFLRKVETGEVPRGSMLIVESLDRLSREQVLDALNQFTGIIGAGITVVTLADNMEYDAQSLNANFGQLIMSLVVMSRAHEESATKSKRLAAAWKHKRSKAAKQKMTSRGPAWLRLSEDRSRFEVIPEAAEAVRLIFQMKAEGVGNESIARRLNELGIWKRPPTARNRAGGWRQSYVSKILGTRAVIGEFQPHKMENGKRVPDGEPIPDYFPAVVDRTLFDRVQAIFARRAALPGHAGGYNGRISNLFGHLARCALCGGAMTHLNKGPKPKGSEYLQCDTARRGLGCNKALVRYDRLEPLLLHFCKGLDPRDLLPDADERKARETATRRTSQQALEGELAGVTRQVENLSDSISHTASEAVRTTLERKLESVLAHQAEIEAQLAALAAQTAEQAATPEAVAAQVRDIEDLLARMDALRGEARSDLRRRLRHELQGLIDRITVKPTAKPLPPGTALTIFFRDGAQCDLLLDDKGGLYLANDGTLIVRLDPDGNVTDIDPDDPPGGGRARLSRQRRVHDRIASALRKQGVNRVSPSIIGCSPVRPAPARACWRGACRASFRR